MRRTTLLLSVLCALPVVAAAGDGPRLSLELGGLEDRGALEAPNQGWHSPGADVVIPNWAFGWLAESNDTARFATLFSLGSPAVAISASTARWPSS